MAKLIPLPDQLVLAQRADAELRTVMGQPVVVQFQIQTLIGLIGLIQLACRHPGVSDEMRRSAEIFADEIGAGLQERGLNDLAALVKAGWVE